MQNETIRLQPGEIRALAANFIAKYLKPLEAEVDAANTLSQETFRDLAKRSRQLDLYGYNIPEVLGGMGLSLPEQIIIGYEMGRTTMVLSQAVGHLPELIRFARPDQREWFVRPCVEGEKFIAYALTEPSGGSDLAHIRTRATRTDDGYLLHGSKCFISHADTADFIVALAVTDEQATSMRTRFSALIVERGTPGLAVGKPMRKMGWNGHNINEVFFEQVRVPADHVLGEDGHGFEYMLATVNSGRVANAARSTGMIEEALRIGAQYALQRQTFGARLADHEVIQFWLANVDVDLACARALTEAAAAASEQSNETEFRVAASRAKLFTSEAVGRATDTLVQILGGAGYVADFPAERMFRDARAFRLGEGTSEMQRLQIARNVLQCYQA